MTDTHSQDNDQHGDQHGDAVDDGTPAPSVDNVTRPANLGPKALLAAQQQGRAAALAGALVDTCPWARATTPADRAAREAWVRGYASGRTQLRSESS